MNRIALPALAGVPIAIKDVLCTLDMPSTSGSKILEGWIPPYDATVVARLRAAEPVGEVRRRLSMSQPEVLSLMQRLRDELEGYLASSDERHLLAIAYMDGTPGYDFINPDHPESKTYAGLINAFPDHAVGFSGISRDGRRPASFASTICEAAHISTSASHIVAMPCSAVPSTRMVMLPARKSIGTVRRDFASEKNGKAIKSWLSRGAMSPGSARNRSSCSSGRWERGAGKVIGRRNGGGRVAPLSAHGCRPSGARRTRGRTWPRSCAGRPRCRGR